MPWCRHSRASWLATGPTAFRSSCCSRRPPASPTPCWPGRTRWPVAASAYDFDAYREARIEPARLQLTTLISDTLGDSAAVEEILMTGAADKEILKTARDQKADLLVVGAGVAQVSPGAGGTLERVARETSCPILVAGARQQLPARPDQVGATRAIDAVP